MVAAAVAGSKYGLTIAWAALVGALFKFVLNEGLARWQLATGTTLLEGWVRHLGVWVRWAFLIYLVIWSFVVGGALISACGMAAHAMAPILSVPAWGIVHSLVAAVLVLLGGYGGFEKIMKWMIGAMFLALIGCAAWLSEPATPVRLVTTASVPSGSLLSILGVIGGVGGSVTLLSYGYWIREKGWNGAAWIKAVRFDLAVAYGLTGLFGVAVVVLAAATLHGTGRQIAGNEAVFTMAALLGDALGLVGHWVFLFGFWAAVATSMLGVWQGVPYLFAEFVGSLGAVSRKPQSQVASSSLWYRGFLVWLAIPPMVLLVRERPVAVVMAYAALGALFMPFLAATLLYLNSRERWVGKKLKNRLPANIFLAGCLLLFLILAMVKISGMV